MINFDDYTNENKTEHNTKWSYILDHPCKILIEGGVPNQEKQITKFKNQHDIDKIYLYTKDPYQAKYQYSTKKREKADLHHYDDPKAFIEYSNDMQDVYKNISEYNLGQKRKILIVFDVTIADMINNKKLNPVVTELFV